MLLLPENYYKPLKQRKMKLRITEAVLAEAYRAKVCRERMEELAESIRKSVKERHSDGRTGGEHTEVGEGTALAAEDENTAGGVRQ